MPHSGPPEEFDKFEKFLQKKSSTQQSPVSNTNAGQKQNPPKSDFAKTLEYLKDKETGEYATDPDWKKFQKFLHHEAEAESDGNDSGQGELSNLPPQLNGLNWGACILSVIWGGVMKVQGMVLLGWTFLMLVPIVGFIFPFYLLFKGNEIAWKSRRWRSLNEFRDIQKKWTIIGIAVLGFIIVLLSVLGMWIKSMIGQLFSA